VAAAVFAGPFRLATLVLLGVPAVALVPLATIWFGLGLAVGLFGATLLAFGPIAVGFAADGAARRPAAVVGAAMALNGAVIAGLIGSQEGLGARVMQAAAMLDAAKIGAMLVVLAAIGVVAVLVVHFLFAVFVPDDRAP
jgi:ABC-type nitrate/sulfonate/bicarbonate transport system permease component